MKQTIQYIVQKFKNLQLIVAALALVGFSAFMPHPVYAAGSLVVSVEPGTGSFQTGSTNSLSLYGTTSGANTSGFSFTVTLTNMTISSFSSAGNPFSLDDIAAGGAAGSTSVTLTVGYSGAAGGGGKQLVGKLQTVASSSAGTATARITGIDAYDANLDPMPGSASNGTYSLVVPPTPPPSTPSTPAPNTPAPSNTVTVPKAPASPSAPVGESKPEDVSQAKAEEIVDTQAPDAVKTQSSTTVKKKKKTSYVPYAIGGVSILAVAGIVMGARQLHKRRLFKKLHYGNDTPSNVVTSATISRIDTSPKVTGGNQQTPTVIKPSVHIDPDKPNEI